VPRRDELVFAALVLAERGREISTSTTSNNTGILPILIGQGESPASLGRKAARWLVDSGLPIDAEGGRRSRASWATCSGPTARGDDGCGASRRTSSSAASAVG
jgi:hypothetical protein